MNRTSFFFLFLLTIVLLLSATYIVITNKLIVEFQSTLNESFQSVNEDEKNVSNATLQNHTNIQAIIESVDESKEGIREIDSLKDYSRNQRSKIQFDALVPFYRKVYDNFQNIRGKTINYDEYFTNNSLNRISLATYGPNIIQNGCNITVQIMDPRISTSHRGAPVFFTLESVGAFIPDACVVITTSKCKIHLHNKDKTQMTVDDALYHHIYNSSLPLFQAMIKRGQVRVKILDHTMYNLKRCDNFYNPSAALMNVNYWTGVFIDGVDSDMVLIMQDDSVLCNEPNFEYLRRYPYIGALWLEYECNLIKKLWKDFTQVPLKEYRDKERSGFLSDQDRRPDLENVTSTIDSYCDKAHGIGAVGNGGLSLRSRKAMVRVINTCPHVLWSGIDLVNRTFPCLVTGEPAEDLYFATVLRGLNAPMPTAYEAAVFSVERVWPSEVTNRFGGPKTYNELVETTRNVMKRVNFAHVNGRIETVPLGFHQAHYFNPKSVTLEGDLAAFCPHNPFVLDPLEKRNKKS